MGRGQLGTVPQIAFFSATDLGMRCYYDSTIHVNWPPMDSSRIRT